MSKNIIGIVVVAAILIGGFVLRDRLSGNAGDLAVGDCFDVPALDTDIADVQHHPCTEAHTGEIFFVGDHPAAAGTVFTEDVLIEFAGTTCLPAATAYMGETLPADYEVGAFYPTDEDWSTGDREISCYLYRVDDGPMSESLKAA
jgi:Septum formation